MSEFEIEKGIEECAENELIKLWMEDGILRGYYKKGTVIGLKQAKELVALRKGFTKGQHVKCILYISHITTMSSEAKKYFSLDEATEGIEKMAFINTSIMIKLLGDIFLKFDKPKVPTKFFTNEAEALKWLSEKNN